ncbi:MAG: hypothetical protein EPN89_11825, partial [Methylovulum sp.]
MATRPKTPTVADKKPVKPGAKNDHSTRPKNATQQLEGGQHKPNPKQAGDKPLARRLLQPDAALAKQTDESRRAARPLNSNPTGTQPCHPCSMSNHKSGQYPANKIPHAPQPTKHRRKQLTNNPHNLGESQPAPRKQTTTPNKLSATTGLQSAPPKAQRPRNQTAQRDGKG